MSEYRMLTGWSLGWLRSTALYDGGDHLLQVTLLGLQHQYERIPYKEIRAVTVAEAPRWTGGRLARLLGFAVLTGLALLPARAGLRVGLALLPAALLVLQIWSISQGRRCLARVISLSGERPLPGLGTMRAAAQAMPQILERVQAAQAGLPRPETMPVFLPGGAGEAYRPQRGLGWGTAVVLLLSAAFVLIYRAWPTSLGIGSTVVFLKLGTLTTAVAWLQMLRRNRGVAAVVVGLVVVDLAVSLLFSELVEWQRWQAAAAAAAVGWRVTAAAVAVEVAQHGGEEGA
jgi:hypothetical protein